MDGPRQTWDAGLYDDRHAFVWKHGAALLELLAPQPGETVLDLGCGTGHLTAAVASAGARVVGLDQSEEMLVQARAAYPALSFVGGDARDFRFEEPFDAIFSNATLHWVRPPEQAVRSVAGALKPGGRFVAEFGGKGNVAAIVRAMRGAAERLGLSLELPRWFFPSVAEYAAMLEAAGLEVRFASLFDRPTPLQGADGLRDWMRMFCAEALQGLPEDRREGFLGAVEEAASATLFQTGGWVADYRRIRILAHQPSDSRKPVISPAA